MSAGAARSVWMVGTGRMALALGAELVRSGWASDLHWIGRRSTPPEHPLVAETGGRYHPLGSLPEEFPDTILLAVADDAIEPVARELVPAAHAGVAVLHTSGALSLEPLAPLAARGASVGSLHPLVSIAEPGPDAVRLLGAYYGIEGDAAASARAHEIVAALGGHALPIGAAGKALYHAAAVVASNHLVALLASAERLMTRAGIAPAEARGALTALAQGSVSSVARSGPVEALTGPVSRGDRATLERHLRELSPLDRALYSGLAREALVLAEKRGLGPEFAARIAELLDPIAQ